MTDVDLNLLPALDALLSEGSVAGAARRLGLSPSAMSRTLARLRAATGDPLLLRAGRSMVASPRAIELRQQVRQLNQAAQAVLRPQPDALDLPRLRREFILRTNEGFMEAFGATLVGKVHAAAPQVGLRFLPKPDKDVQALRDGPVELEIGVLGRSGPEVRLQALFRDHFVGVVRHDHPLLRHQPITPADYAACAHVVTSRRGDGRGPIDAALAALQLSRRIVAVVPDFRAALAIAAQSELVALVSHTFFTRAAAAAAGLRCFALPVATAPITVSQMWHPRLDADPAHRWLRQLVKASCGIEESAPQPPR